MAAEPDDRKPRISANHTGRSGKLERAGGTVLGGDEFGAFHEMTRNWRDAPKVVKDNVRTLNFLSTPVPTDTAERLGRAAGWTGRGKW